MNMDYEFEVESFTRMIHENFLIQSQHRLTLKWTYNEKITDTMISTESTNYDKFTYVSSYTCRIYF